MKRKHRMSDAHRQHMFDLILEFGEIAKEKYTLGQHEHGGKLWKKKGLIDMAIDEAVDQVVYLLTLRKQIEEAGVELGEIDEEA